jgi:glycosyltransferase involved in cell wall biosynthesis
MLILPTYTDTWGLVVNEAMACGLPVILSRAAGCAPDLVRENWNGLLVPPSDVPSLASSMERIATRPDLLAMMGANSMQHIDLYTPKEWATAIARMLEAAGGARE